jgi:hypothetical protein
MQLDSRRDPEAQSKTFKAKAVFTGMKGMKRMKSGDIYGVRQLVPDPRMGTLKRDTCF